MRGRKTLGKTVGFGGEKWWKSHEIPIFPMKSHENVEKSNEFPMKMMGNHHFPYENDGKLPFSDEHDGKMWERPTFWMRRSGICLMGEAWSYFMGFGGGLIMGLNGNLIHNDNLIHLDLVGWWVRLETRLF